MSQRSRDPDPGTKSQLPSDVASAPNTRIPHIQAAEPAKTPAYAGTTSRPTGLSARR